MVPIDSVSMGMNPNMLTIEQMYGTITLFNCVEEKPPRAAFFDPKIRRKEMAKAVEPFDESNLLATLQGMGYSVEAVADTSDLKDFELTDKDDLINYPFVIVEVLAKDSLQYKNEYVVCRAVDRDGNKIVFADGSYGICAQVLELMVKHENVRKPINSDDETGWSGWKYPVAIPVMKGLAKNEYDTKILNKQTGEVELVHGVTYRLQFK